MSLLRRIRPDEQDSFTDLPEPPDAPDGSPLAERNAEVRRYLAGLFERGCTRAEWCFTGTTAESGVTSAVLWAMPGADVPAAIVLLELDWAALTARRGLAVLTELTEVARSYGTRELHHVIDVPAAAPQFQEHPEARERVLTTAGFTLVREAQRWRRTTDLEPPPEPTALTFRPIGEVGRDQYVATLAASLHHTEDSWLTTTIAEHGLVGAAERYLVEMEEFDHDPTWFELGFDAEDRPVAVSMPARNPSHPVVGYVGVVPEARGNGYAGAVLARITRLLLATDGTEIQGDCDHANAAMAKAFTTAGYTHFADRLDLTAHLD